MTFDEAINKVCREAGWSEAQINAARSEADKQSPNTISWGAQTIPPDQEPLFLDELRSLYIIPKAEVERITRAITERIQEHDAKN